MVHHMESSMHHKDSDDQPGRVGSGVVAKLGGPCEVYHGAMKLMGYLTAANGNECADYRLYIDDSFRCYYEFKTDALLHLVKGGSDPCCPMDAVWIRREAPLTKCTTGYAAAVAASHDMLGDDLGGGPRPPH